MTDQKRPTDFETFTLENGVRFSFPKELLKGRIPPDAIAGPHGEVAEYLPMMAEYDITEEEKLEFLALLADIIQRFVELGFGDDSVSIIQGILEENTGQSEG